MHRRPAPPGTRLRWTQHLPSTNYFRPSPQHPMHKILCMESGVSPKMNAMLNHRHAQMHGRCSTFKKKPEFRILADPNHIQKHLH